MNEKLSAKVIARNRVNATANEVLPKILEVLKPFVGRKIRLKTGGMTAKLYKALDPFHASSPENLVWFRIGYGLEVHFKTSQNCGGGHYRGCFYAEVTATVAEIKTTCEGVILEKINPATQLRTDYSVQEIEIARKAVTVARDALRKAEYQLVGFGEHDNG